jgi:multisubunit Na+/H+ antiporter MnhG subunit
VRATLDAAIVIDVLTAVMWMVGSAFAMLAALGLLRMPDAIARASYVANVPLWDGTVVDERRRDTDGAP